MVLCAENSKALMLSTKKVPRLLNVHCIWMTLYSLTHNTLVDSYTVILDESICYFRDVGSILSLLFYF